MLRACSFHYTLPSTCMHRKIPTISGKWMQTASYKIWIWPANFIWSTNNNYARHTSSLHILCGYKNYQKPLMKTIHWIHNWKKIKISEYLHLENKLGLVDIISYLNFKRWISWVSPEEYGWTIEVWICSVFPNRRVHLFSLTWYYYIRICTYLQGIWRQTLKLTSKKCM